MKFIPTLYVLLCVVLGFLWSPLAIAQSSYLSLQNTQNDESKKIERSEQKIKSIIGRSFWIKPNPDASIRNVFYETLEAAKRSSKPEGFLALKEISFKVDGYEIYAYLYSIRYILKISFEDGKEAWLEADDYFEESGRSPIKNLFKGYLFNHQEYVFEAPSEKVFAELKAKEELEAKLEKQLRAKQAAIAKAKGGVRIGMTTEEAKKSNWGKPAHINRTTTADGVSEQWVYGSGNYLYFKNGILSTVQN